MIDLRTICQVAGVAALAVLFCLGCYAIVVNGKLGQLADLLLSALAFVLRRAESDSAATPLPGVGDQPSTNFATGPGANITTEDGQHGPSND